MTLPDHPDAPQGVEAQYREALDQGRFLIQRCAGCDRAVFYPRMICPHCGAEKLDWVTPDGRGTVYSTTVVRRKPDAGGDYNVALIDLQEGVRLMSRVDGVAPDGRRVQGPKMTSSGVSACERAQPIPCMSWTGIMLVFR